MNPETDKEQKKLKQKLKMIEQVPERGIETWFRLTSKNLYSRLQIVDTKAGMLITSNSLIISIVLGSLYTRLDEDRHLIFAVAPLIITNMLSIVFAIIAAVPNKMEKVKMNQVTTNVDLMNFESFYGLSEADYKTSIKGIMNSGSALYDSMMSDIYLIGQKLARKYRLIRISFMILLYGICISVLMFALCHLMF